MDIYIASINITLVVACLVIRHFSKEVEGGKKYINRTPEGGFVGVRSYIEASDEVFEFSSTHSLALLWFIMYIFPNFFHFNLLSLWRKSRTAEENEEDALNGYIFLLPSAFPHDWTKCKSGFWLNVKATHEESLEALVLVYGEKTRVNLLSGDIFEWRGKRIHKMSTKDTNKWPFSEAVLMGRNWQFTSCCHRWWWWLTCRARCSFFIKLSVLISRLLLFSLSK